MTKEQMWSVLLVLLLPIATLAESPAASVDGLERLVAKWVDLRARIADEKRSWKEQETRWRDEIELLKTEKASLQKEIDEASEREASVQEDRVELLADKEKMGAALKELPPLLDRAEAEIRKLKPLIPPPLAVPLKDAFQQIPATHEETRRLTLSRRLQLVIALYSQIETIQHNIHVTNEVLPADGGAEKEMDVLYLGLARAFAVSHDNKWAAIGTPATGGWNWEARKEIAEQVRKAIAIFNRKQTAELIDLPLHVRRSLDEGGRTEDPASPTSSAKASELKRLHRASR